MRYTLFLLLATVCTVLVSACTPPGYNDSTTKPSTTSGAVVSRINPPVYGSGAHSIIIFADFQCGACQAFNTEFGKVFLDYADAGKITLEYRQYPLNMHKNAKRDALAAYCAVEQGVYRDFKDGMYALEIEKKNSTISDTERLAIATDAGIADMKKYSECLSTDKYLEQLAVDKALGDSYGLTGTPTLVLDGKKLDMAAFSDNAQMKAFFDRYLSK
jgi:protein-disulfide isomerase